MYPSEPAIEPGWLGERLDALDGIERVRAAARDAGVRAYLVGGTVRDLLLGRDRLDLDVAVEGDPLALARRLGGEAREHERFATATVQLDGHTIDLAAARTESYPHPGALPEVRPAGITEDLARRDFTVNAMAAPLAGGGKGGEGATGLIDPHGGLADLRAGVLRDLHERSFIDDPTRALRAARYAARLGLEPEPGTLERLRAADLDTVSTDRVEAELRRLAGEDRARRGFELLAAWGLLDLPPGAGEAIDAIVALTDEPAWSQLDHRAEAVLAAARGANGPAALVEARPARPSEAVRVARGHGPVDLLLARARGAAWLDSYVSEWRRVRLEITGSDLLAAGIPEGPRIGRGLSAALEAKLDAEVAGREHELRVALAATRDPKPGA